MATKRNANGTKNHLLLSLPRRDFERLMDKAERVEMTMRQEVYEPNQPIPYVYFPEDSVISLVSEMKDGSIIEVGTVGNEGMVGVPILLGAASSTLKSFAQVPGMAMRMKTSEFKRHLTNGSSLHAKLNLYTQALFTQLSQSVACNRLHSVEQRCARWLLMTSDRVDKDQFRLTQEFLAQMLGIRRASVNAVVQVFQQKGMIKYSQGQIQITNRQKLEGIACECYEIIRNEYRRLTDARG